MRECSAILQNICNGVFLIAKTTLFALTHDFEKPGYYTQVK